MSAAAQSPTKRVKASYTDEQVAEALLALKANGNNAFRTARDLNIPRQTLESWAKGEVRSTPEVEQIQREKEPELAGRYTSAAGLFLAHATKPEVIEKMDGLQAMKASGIAIDKSQLLNGLPTSIVGNVDRQELSITLFAALGELNAADFEDVLDPLERARNITPAGPQSALEGPQDIALFQR